MSAKVERQSQEKTEGSMVARSTAALFLYQKGTPIPPFPG